MDLSISDAINLAPPAGPLFWFKADAGVTANGSNQVNLWKDQTPNHFDVIPIDNLGNPAGTANWPVFTPNVVNGLPGLLWNGAPGGVGSGTYLQYVPNPSLPPPNVPTVDDAPVTVLALVHALSFNGGVVFCMRLRNQDLECGMRLAHIFGIGATQIPISNSQDVGTWKNTLTNVDYTGLDVVMEWRYYGAAANPQAAVFVNGVNIPFNLGTSDTMSGYSGQSGFSIGYCQAVDGTNNTTWNGYITETIGYLGTDDATAVAARKYLMERGGLT